MPVPLSDDTRQAAALILEEPDLTRVERRLVAETSETLPLWNDLTPKGLERIRFAVLRLIARHPEREDLAFAEAVVDWRDLLVAAGFAESVTEHRRWFKRLVASRG